MRIVVLVKHVPDTEEPRHLDPTTGDIDRSEGGVIDEITSRALSWALEVRDNVGGDVIALTMGPDDAAEALRGALAIGANESVHVLDDQLAGSDAAQTSAVLAAALREVGFDLVVAGDVATDGEVGAVPAMLAERLGVPHLTYVTAAEVTAHGVTATRDNAETSYQVETTLPAVVSVTEKVAEPRVPGFRGIMGAKRKPRRVLGVGDLAIEPALLGRTNAAWTVITTAPKPPRTKGTVVTDDGTAARQIADFLTRNQLIGR